eukprot:m.398100 g.398100  ORF g.398100 m.398100 type:complete len:331 (+) comp21134_c0_seq7:112-1104(+)
MKGVRHTIKVDSISKGSVKRNRAVRKHVMSQRTSAAETICTTTIGNAADMLSEGLNISRPKSWHCCQNSFTTQRDIHKHIATCHGHCVSMDVNKICAALCDKDSRINKVELTSIPLTDPCEICGTEIGVECFPINNEAACLYDEDIEFYFPAAAIRANKVEQDTDTTDESRQVQTLIGDGPEVVLLFYTYVELRNPPQIAKRISEICKDLQLLGKIRVAREGVNGTVSGFNSSTDDFISAMLTQDPFCDVGDLSRADFKSSRASAGAAFQALHVTVVDEIITLGVPPVPLLWQLCLFLAYSRLPMPLGLMQKPCLCLFAAILRTLLHSVF